MANQRDHPELGEGGEIVPTVSTHQDIVEIADEPRPVDTPLLPRSGETMGLRNHPLSDELITILTHLIPGFDINLQPDHPVISALQSEGVTTWEAFVLMDMEIIDELSSPGGVEEKTF